MDSLAGLLVSFSLGTYIFIFSFCALFVLAGFGLVLVDFNMVLLC